MINQSLMTDTAPVAVSLFEVAHAMRTSHSGLKKSFQRFLAVIPDAGDHVEAVEEVTRGGYGGRSLTYRLDAVALCAFLYWRQRKGRLPRFFGGDCHYLEGEARHD